MQYTLNQNTNRIDTFDPKADFKPWNKTVEFENEADDGKTFKKIFKDDKYLYFTELSKEEYFEGKAFRVTTILKRKK